MSDDEQRLHVDPDVFLREMIQNAHESITRRAQLARERGEEPPAPSYADDGERITAYRDFWNRRFPDGLSAVLPAWATFVQVVLEYDDVPHEAALAAVQRALGYLIVSGHDLSETMGRHSNHILAMCVQPESEHFFRAVADLVPLETDQGPMTIADAGSVVHYITEAESARQYMQLGTARGLRVFDCTDTFAERFLKKYAETWPERVRLVRLDQAGAEAALFEPLDASEAEHYAALEQAYATLFDDRAVRVQVSRFEPATVPAVLDDPLTLHLNAANPIIRKLADRTDLSDEIGGNALRALYNNALLLPAHTLPAETVQTMFTQFNDVIDLMLRLAEQVADAADAAEVMPDPAPTYLSCSVTLPEGEPRSEEIFAAVRSVLETRPYYWQVRRADSPPPDSDLPPDLDEPPARAALNVAVFAGPRLNQGLINEVSIGQILDLPQLILRDEGHAPLPSSFADVPQRTVHGLGAVLRKEVLIALAEHPDVRRVRDHERYLSPSVLAWCAGLDEGVGETISARYPTWPEFLRADSAEVARTARIDVALVEAAKSGLRLLAEED